MANTCPHTKEVCPVLVNVDRLNREVRTPEEILAMDGLSEAVNSLLARGSCSGAFSQAGDETDQFYSGTTYYCGSNMIPEIAEEIDNISEDENLGYSELFEIENIGKLRGVN